MPARTRTRDRTKAWTSALGLSPGSTQPLSSTQDPDLGLDSDSNPDRRADRDRDGDSDPDMGTQIPTLVPTSVQDSASGLGLDPDLCVMRTRSRPRLGPPRVASAPDSGSRPRTFALSGCRPEPRLTRTRLQAQTSGPAPRRPQVPELMPTGGPSRPLLRPQPRRLRPPHPGCLEEALRGLPASRAGADRRDPRQETNSSTASRQSSPFLAIWSVQRPQAAIMATWVPVMG